ncbi:hypothetical protein PFDG_04869 [Plasmodium falciparum Dd2]|uniref:Uncharacterized protein n=1 Tax=Plasmodium falciparum (isolate Dd2) TaxID=57267 RepID=A0A0L7M9S0_PLAF4|nr:hypothetical protein PFDG_04869 [Plasmodium falciparum Dd2]
MQDLITEEKDIRPLADLTENGERKKSIKQYYIYKNVLKNIPWFRSANDETPLASCLIKANEYISRNLTNTEYIKKRKILLYIHKYFLKKKINISEYPSIILLFLL